MMRLGRTTLTVVALMVVLAGAGVAQAVLITFDDAGLTAGTYYFPGQNVVSGGTTVALTDYVFANGAIWPADVARIVSANAYGLTNNALALTGMDACMSFGTPAQTITLQYAAINGTEGILTVNGQDLRFSSSPIQLSGQTVGGVNVTAVAGTSTMTGYNTGTLTLTGNIQSLQIGGQNMMIDTITPEPATLGLLALGGLLLARKKK